MAKINLLPWREERRQERLQEFQKMMFLAFLVAGGVFYIAIVIADSMVSEQEARNKYLQDEIAKVDAQIAEIRTIEQERNKLLARMQVIQDLQESRPKVVKVLDALAHVLPEGVHFEQLRREGDKITINGMAESNARVSVLMNRIDANTEFEESELQVVKKDTSQKQFALNVNESKPKKSAE
jgi:type IV pilus assembly protein PilN